MTWRDKPLTLYWPDNRSDPATFNRDSGPVSIRPSFPTALFQVGGFHIQCFEQPWMQPTLTLVERPIIDHGLLRKHLTLYPHHRQLIESYLSPCVPQNSSIEIGYSPRATDQLGRKYCCTMGGQRMPRAARLLLFGRNHCEIDLKGSFYELVRRLGLLYMPDHVPFQPLMIFVPSSTATLHPSGGSASPSHCQTTSIEDYQQFN